MMDVTGLHVAPHRIHNASLVVPDAGGAVLLGEPLVPHHVVLAGRGQWRRFADNDVLPVHLEEAGADCDHERDFETVRGVPC